MIRGRWVVLALFVALCAWLVPGALQLRHDDDVLAFLPPEHPDVVAFRDVADRYGMLEVALVGVRGQAGEEDLLRPEPIAKLRALHAELTEIPGVRLVLSLPDFPDAKVVDDTLVVDQLVPKSIDTAEAIRERVLANSDALGNVVAVDGQAAAFLVFLRVEGSEDRLGERARVLAAVRAAVADHWSGPMFFGGSPFIEHEASESSRTDIEGLSPVVIGVLVLASAVLLGSTTAAVLNLLVTGLGVLLIVGAHGRFGEPFTIVSSTTPVMMVALGGAFGMHILAGYQRATGSPTERADATLRELWSPVVLSGVTTATAFFALLVMPQVPMQRFGVVAGAGVLLLLVLALLVLPALLSVLPSRLLPTRPNRRLPRPPVPPTWVLVLLAAAGVYAASRMAADPDTANVFDPDSEPRQATAFFDEHFGGSQYLQVAIDADLTQPAVLREIRELGEAITEVPGVAEVRSLIDPVAMLTEGFGGRRGVPSTEGRARTVVINLAHHPAAAQLMLPTADGAIVHVKLAPADSTALVEATAKVREIFARYPDRTIRVGSTAAPEVASARREQVRHRVERISGRAVDAAQLDALVSGGSAGAAMLAEVVRLRARALGTDELTKPLPAAVYERLDPNVLLAKRGADLEAYLTQTLPELVAADEEGAPFVAEYLGEWIDEATSTHTLAGLCEGLGLPADRAGTRQCDAVITALKELEDETWAIPEGVDAPATSEHAWASTFTGQPVIGLAFAESVTQSLRLSTLVSLALAEDLIAAA